MDRKKRANLRHHTPSPPLYSGISLPRHSKRSLGRFLECPTHFTWEFPQNQLSVKGPVVALSPGSFVNNFCWFCLLLDVIPHVCSRSVESGVPRSQAGVGARVGRPRRAVVSLSSPFRLGQSGDKETMACESKQRQGVSTAPGSPPCRALQILIRISSKGRRDFLD